MPQMSPLSWISIFITLVYFMYLYFNSLPVIKNNMQSKMIFNKKQKNMKW